MKAKNIFFGLLLVGISGFAQIRFGAKAGLNIASLKGTYPPNVTNKQKVGFHTGLTAEYPLANPKFFVVGELLYSGQGSVTQQSQPSQQLSNGTYTYTDQKTSLSLTAIDLPIMLKYYVIDNLGIEGGPQFGYIVKAAEKIETSSTSDASLNSTITFDPKKDGTYMRNGATYNYKKTVDAFDFGLNLGAVYDISQSFYVQLHYYFGVTAIQSVPSSTPVFTTNDYTNHTTDYKNTVFQVSLGYKFN